MSEIVAFFIIACISAAVLLVSIVELALTVRRRKVQESLEKQLKDLKIAYNESVNKLVLESDSKLDETEKQLDAISGQTETVKTELSAEHAAELKALHEKSKKALEKAEAKAKALENDAKSAADAFLEKRKTEVEGELMDLVMKVTKKVLPDGLTYEAHKELVAAALKDVRAEKS